MNAEREELLGRLEAHYKGSGWSVKRDGDGTLHADGPGGVTWIGAALTSAELADEQIERRLLEIADRRMPGGGELCPLDILPARDCAAEVEALLDRLGLGGQPHISVYSLAA